MLWACLLLIPISAALALVLTFAARALGHRLNTLDGAGVAGQIKAPARRVPNTGGIAIFWAFALPIALGLIVLRTPLYDELVVRLPELRGITPRLLAMSADAWVFLSALLALHVLGVIDDRRPLRAGTKLVIMMFVAAAVVLLTGTRLLTVLDTYSGGSWLSIALTVAWIIIVTNAMNFIDNTDGLCAGVAMVAGVCFLCAAAGQDQWLIASMLALLVGACGGFLILNGPWPRATIFMGDGGSLVVGFALAFLTVRTTYAKPDLAGGWFGVLMPLVVLAVPLYDFASVVLIRISQGRSPFMGDLQHLAHRLQRRGLSVRATLAVILCLTGITGLGAVILGTLQPWQAAVVGGQTLLVLTLVAAWEFGGVSVTSTPAARGAP
ncbi:MraY family glycosyltransferase [soil metagenome]